MKSGTLCLLCQHCHAQEVTVVTTAPRGTHTRVQQVIRSIRTDIEAGGLTPGEVLPSTTELSTQFGVSKDTINKAMKELQTLGLVEGLQRSKRRVATTSAATTRREPLKPPTPTAILIGGYAGTGKSELGRMLAHETGWSLVDKDTITRPLVEMALETMGGSPHDRESDTYLSTVRPREYEALSMTAEENIGAGASVILSAPYLKEFTDQSWLLRTRSELEAAGARVVFIWVTCDLDSMLMYLRKRGAARDAAKLSHWSEYAAGLRLDFRPGVPHVLVDNSVSAEPLRDQAKRIVQTLMN